MTDVSLDHLINRNRHYSFRYLIIGLFLLLPLVVGAVGAYVLIQDRAEKDLQVWRSRLSQEAGNRARLLSEWASAQIQTVASLATNPTTQLFATEVALAGPDEGPIDPGYLRNLMEFTAFNAGFRPDFGQTDFDAAREHRTNIGFFLTDLSGKLYLTSGQGSVLPDTYVDFLQHPNETDGNGTILLPALSGRFGELVLGFLHPVYRIQTDPTAETQIAWLVGVHPLDNDLNARVRHRLDTAEGLQTALVRREGNSVGYLVPPDRDIEPLSLSLPADNQTGLAAAQALAVGNGFFQGLNHQGEDVLAASRPVAGTPWTLLVMVPESLALAPLKQRLTGLTLAFTGFGLLMILSLAVAWRHGASRRAVQTAADLDDLADRHRAQEILLRSITDNQPARVFILDHDNRVQFTNKRFANALGLNESDIIGKPLQALYGPAAAAPYIELGRQVAATRQVAERDRRTEASDGSERIYRIAAVPLSGEGYVRSGAILVLEDDVTDLVLAKERNERILEGVVRTLVSLVDSRDPYSGDHSQRVGRCAGVVAREMGLDDSLVRTAETAGILMNVGKIGVSRQILTKPEPLTAEERDVIRDSVGEAAEILSGIAFPGPVVESLRQAHALWKGDGQADNADPTALQIAKVLLVCNAFVAMVTPRAHREKLSMDGALEVLFASGTYDTSIVAALTNWVAHKGGREQIEAWAHA